MKVTSRSEFPLVLDMTAFSEASDAASRKDSVYDPLYENPAMEEDFVESLRASKSIVWLEKLLRSAEGVAKELIEQYGEAVRFDDVDEEQYEAIARHLTPHMFTPTDASFSGSQERMLYQLHAVIMHRGSAHSGHYFAYIRDNLGEGRWELPELEELRRTACGVSTQQVAALSSENGTSPMESVEMVPANGSEVSVASNTELPVAPAAIAPQQNGNAHIKEGTPNAAKPPAPQKATPQKAYLQDREVGAYIVEEASPLALIIKVMRAASPPSSKETHVHQRGANRPGKPLQGKPLPNARFKVNFIGTEVGNLIKNSWANAFKLKFGTLEAFMRAQTDLMKVFDNGEVFLLTNNIHVVSSAVYQQKFAKLAPPGGSGQQHKKQPQQPQNGAGNKRTPGRLFNSQQLDLAGNVDAQLARQLQAELDLERHQEEEEECLGSGAGAGAAPDSWETAGAKRKERKINIDGVSASSKLSTSAAASGKAKTAKAELTPQQARVAILSAEIVSHFYGNYFEFNDSTVEPISLGHLQRAFEGGDSAYLLVYRAISAPVDAHQYLAASRTLLRQGTANKVMFIYALTFVLFLKPFV